MQIYFAPLEGITDDVYRYVHHKHFDNISKYFIPFISPTSQAHFTNRELKSVSRTLDAHFCCIPQVLTKDPDGFLIAARMLAELGYTEVNLNLGCPSGTVTGKGKGSAMLRDTDALKTFFDSIFASCPISVSVKTRIGYLDTDDWDEITGVILSYPFSEVIIHPRTRQEFYKGAVHTEAFERFYEKNSLLPVFNGDLFSPADISEISSLFPNTKAVMIGRGLIANPFLAGGEFDVGELKSFHEDLLYTYINDRPQNAALGHMREIMLYMSSCFEDSKRLLKKMQKSRNLDEYRDAANAMFDTCVPKAEPWYSPIG